MRFAKASEAESQQASSRILFYYPSNQRSLHLESTLAALSQRVELVVLTTCEPGPLHHELARLGVPCYSTPVAASPSPLYYARQIANLVRFTKQHRVTSIFSNLQHANIIAVLAQPLLSANVIAFRHHFHYVFSEDEGMIRKNRMEALFDVVINAFAKTIVVPSQSVKDGMVTHERLGTKPTIEVVPYLYDFERYARPDAAEVERVRREHPCCLRLIMIGRLIPLKRHGIILPALTKLVAEGVDVRLLILGDGPERARLTDSIDRQGLKDRVSMLGFRADPASYMAASDLLIHPSLTEASSNVVKEMALLDKPSVVCQGVGDFDDYIAHGHTGYSLSRGKFPEELHSLISDISVDPAQLERVGRAARREVVERFGLTASRLEQYLELAR